MRTHVDWITFTMRPVYKSYYEEGTPSADVYADGIKGAFETTFSREIVEKVFAGVWEKREQKRAPYVDSWGLKNAGISLFASPTLPHICVEIAGEGCERIIMLESMDALLGATCERITRVDIATDIETSLDPEDFVKEVSHKRMQAHGVFRTPTGITCYVGSQKSDRFARVYRYLPPHPRADLLRIEHVFRREYAKNVAKEIARTNVESVQVAGGMAFGWTHESWQISTSESAEISLVSMGREAGKTLIWLISSAAPAFKRLCADGGISDGEEFLRKYFLS